MSSLAAVTLTATSNSASAASSVNWAKVTQLTKTGPKSMSALVAAAKKEGKLNVIALPANWANYGALISSFSKKYKIKVNSENPDGSSAQEIAALTADKGRSIAPDVIDVGTSYALTAKASHLLAPYKVTTWNEIPGSLKDAAGYWFDDYGGYVAIGCNTASVPTCPTSFKQMLSETKAQGYKIGLNNSPTTSNSALAAVQAAAIANGGSLSNIAPGVSFFAKLNKNGTFVPVIANATTVQSGATNVVIWWDYLQASGISPSTKTWKVSLPSDAAVGEYYTQAISSSAPDPAAARLWEEYLYSVTGQNLWLQGLARPVELAYMQAHNQANKKWLAKLPPLPHGVKPLFPTTSQIASAAATVTNTWNTQVGAG
ncbi:MAG: ABC transporter substrate-binding protein [Acidimicrobiaceae bacterium]|nr:ABC transporter substrate-binding protein [Acidimicrobiaceae bacterium]